MTDFDQEDVAPPCESDIEERWLIEKGVNPETGEAWLTPRMERNAARLAAAWDEHDDLNLPNISIDRKGAWT